jgi:hypothetical protein
MDPVRPDYLFSICNLTTKTDKEVEDTVLQVWKSQASCDFLTSLHSSFPDALRHKADVTLQNFVDSMYVKILDTKEQGDASAPTFNIYVNASHIPDDGLWCLLRNFYTAQNYALPFQEPGNASATFFHCSICHSVDHPRGMCEFPTIEGWNGPVRKIPGTKYDAPNRQRGQFPGQFSGQRKFRWSDTFVD